MMQYAEMGSSSKFRVLIYKDFFDKEFKSNYTYFWNNKYVDKYMKNKKKYIVFIVFAYLFNLFKRVALILFIIPKYDVLFIQRCVIPYFKPTFLRYLKGKNVKIIYDIDDALHLNKKYNCDEIAKLSNCVIVGSNELKRHYDLVSKSVFLVPTVDDNRKYIKYIENTFDNKCIGWIGSQTTINNLSLLINPLNRIMSNYKNVYLKIISDDVKDYDKRIKNVKFSKWHSDTYIEEMKEFTIGIMPLFDNEFNKGKCGFKLIQFLDLEKPILASECGENKYIVSNYGKVCNSEEEWYNELENILFNLEIYNYYIQNIKETFEQNYGFVHNKDLIINIIYSIIKKHGDNYED